MKNKVWSGVAALMVGVLILTLTVHAPAGPRRDALTIHNFNVEIDGVVLGHFKEVTGLDCETEVIEVRQAGNTIHLLSGATRCGPLVLRREVSEGPELWSWNREVANGNVDRKSMSIVILSDRNGVERCDTTSSRLGR